MKEWKLEGVSGLEGPSLQSGNAGDEKEARNKAIYYLQFSSKTEWELRKKLAEQGFLPASVDSAIRFVKAHRYLDDGEYAARYIERNQRKKSRKQMVFELRQKGIDEETLNAAFEENPVDEEEQILRLLEKKGYRGEEAEREEKQKISAYLARKGFAYEAIQRAMINYARKNRD